MRFGLAALSGVLLGLAFPRFHFGYVAFIGFLPLLIAIHLPGSARENAVSARNGFKLGMVTGFIFFLLVLHWIPRLPQENVTIPFVMYPIVLIVALYLALWSGLAAMASAWLARRGIPVGLSFPLAWTLIEAGKAAGVLGFPWGSIGYAMADTPHIIQFASLTGLWGVTLWVLLVNGAVHAYLDLPWAVPKASALIVLALLFGAPFTHGRYVLEHKPPRPAVRVGLIQPNTDKDKWTSDVRGDVLDDLLAHTRFLAEAEADQLPVLMVWPETAVPAFLPREVEQLARVRGLVDSMGVALLTGYPDGTLREDRSWRVTNSAGLFLPGRGRVAQYDKRHLVPFSEYMPLPILDLFDFGQSSFSPGTVSGVMDAFDPPFGVLICFESIFPGPSRDLAQNGARFLVNITNDQWFGDSAAPVQHLRMNVLRVIENRMGMARAANTGISAILDPYGFLTRTSVTFEPVRFAGPVELSRGTTFYTRHGDWILWVAGVLLGGMFLWAWRRPR